MSNLPFLSNKGTADENTENEEPNNTVRDDFFHFQMNSTNVSTDNSERIFKW